MLPVTDFVGADPPNGEEAEREIEGGQCQVDTEGCPAIFSRELFEALGEGQVFSCGFGCA